MHRAYDLSRTAERRLPPLPPPPPCESPSAPTEDQHQHHDDHYDQYHQPDVHVTSLPSGRTQVLVASSCGFASCWFAHSSARRSASSEAYPYFCCSLPTRRSFLPPTSSSSSSVSLPHSSRAWPLSSFHLPSMMFQSTFVSSSLRTPTPHSCTMFFVPSAACDETWRRLHSYDRSRERLTVSFSRPGAWRRRSRRPRERRLRSRRGPSPQARHPHRGLGRDGGNARDTTETRLERGAGGYGVAVGSHTRLRGSRAQTRGRGPFAGRAACCVASSSSSIWSSAWWSPTRTTTSRI